MANYKLVIPTADGTRTGGYSASGTNTDFTVDRGVTRTPKFRVLAQTFGDGYEQRILDGINAKTEEYTASFANRDPDEIYAIADFLDNTIPTSFNFYINTETVKVTAEDYSITHNSNIAATLNLKLKRVYEA